MRHVRFQSTRYCSLKNLSFQRKDPHYFVSAMVGVPIGKFVARKRAECSCFPDASVKRLLIHTVNECG